MAEKHRFFSRVIGSLSLVAFALTIVCAAGEGASSVKERTDPLIREHRMGTLTVQTTPGASVKVTQLRHEFWFGTALSAGMFGDRANPEDREKYLEVVKNNFNAAVHENALKWYSTERRGPDNPDYEAADRVLEWCEKNNIPMRGHCIFWAADRYVQGWVKELDDEALRKTLERRAREVTSRYRGRIGEYDLNNEMVPNNYYRRRLGKDVVADMARWAREGDPNATLFVNDYNVLTGRVLDAYAEQIKDFLDRGIPIGGIGCQGHSHGRTVDFDQVNKALDRLAQFGLPIRITEFLMNTTDEERKAQDLADYYRTCFAHPAVTGILMWGFWEGRIWRPEAHLWKRDWTPTPAALAYRDLVYKEWWTNWEGKANADGVCEVPAFFGKHKVESNGQTVEVELKKKDGKATVNMVTKQ